jgi:hypothetical protein
MKLTSSAVLAGVADLPAESGQLHLERLLQFLVNLNRIVAVNTSDQTRAIVDLALVTRRDTTVRLLCTAGRTRI